MAFKTFAVVFTREAEQDLIRLDHQILSLILDRLSWLGTNTEIIIHKRLKGSWEKAFKLRVSEYRIIYQLNKDRQEVVILKIGHQKDVYK